MDNQEEDFDAIFEPRLTRDDIRDEIAKTLRDVATFNAQAYAGQQNAIREVSAVHPDFEERRSRMLGLLEEIPLLRDAISAAEANPQLAPTLPALYELTYRASHAPTETESTATAPSKVETEQRSDLGDETVQYQASLASQRVDLSPENRKHILAALERKGVLDVEF